ncbi:MAG: MarR family winged helix-turn-helix transcriptional regulator, partial [Bdellovibrionota bacterium]
MSTTTCDKIPSDSLGYLLNKVALRIKDRLDANLEPVGLRCRHYGLLVFLEKMGPMSQHQLGELLRTDRTTMVTIIDEA